jgi:hypothetical protein
MNRTEITDSYTVENGMIVSPGKFEGGPIFAPYFSEAASDGEEISFIGDPNGDYASLVEIDADDRREFPELGSAKYVLVTESYQGFVGVMLVLNELEAQAIRDGYAVDGDESDDDNDC